MNDSGNTGSTIPTGEQLGETRLKVWHQQGEALLTIENLRSWLNVAGLVLFAPRPQIVAPAPSLVEAVLGAPKAEPTLAETSDARSLLARLVAEGMAVPLNLLGAANGIVGDTPDFVCTPAVFSYIFTLRGDKAWKQPPVTTGAMKVSPLALATHEAMAKRGAISVYDLTTELGKEVTETAVMRAMAELWAHLRVLPVAQPDGAATLWELTGARFTKQIKAGANAGQPSALSALISLYLGQAVVASEDEIESFLSPVAARSRIRDVVHALMAARQLETVAIEGRTVLHVSGEMPAFAAPAVVAQEAEAAVEGEAGVDGAGRISKFVAKPKKIGTGYLAKAAPAKFGAKPLGKKPAFGASRPAFKPGFKESARSGFSARTGAGPAPDRERRPFAKPAAAGFDKPWDEEKAKRMASIARPSQVEGGDAGEAEASAETERAPRVYTPRTTERRDSGERKPSFGRKPAFGSKPSFGGKPSFGSRPFTPREGSSGGDSRPPRREFAPRRDAEGAAPRKTFSKPGTFGRKREGVGGKPSFGDARPPRRDFGPRTDGGDRPAASSPRAPGSYAPRPFSPRSSGPRAGGDRAASAGSAARKPFTPRPSGGAGFAGRPSFPRDRGDRQERGTPTESGKRVYRKFDAPRERSGERSAGDRPARPARTFDSDRPARSEGGGYKGKSTAGFSARPANRPSGKPGGGFKKPGAKSSGSFADRPGSTFAKFADNNKPFGKRPPARKYKPKEGESA